MPTAPLRMDPLPDSDATGARVAGRTRWPSRWPWAFQTPEAGYHALAAGRGGEVIGAFLDAVEREVHGSDLDAPRRVASRRRPVPARSSRPAGSL